MVELGWKTMRKIWVKELGGGCRSVISGLRSWRFGCRSVAFKSVQAVSGAAVWAVFGYPVRWAAVRVVASADGVCRSGVEHGGAGGRGVLQRCRPYGALALYFAAGGFGDGGDEGVLHGELVV